MDDGRCGIGGRGWQHSVGGRGWMDGCIPAVQCIHIYVGVDDRCSVV